MSSGSSGAESASDRPTRAAKPAATKDASVYQFHKPDGQPKNSVDRVIETLAREVKCLVDEAARFEKLLDAAQAHERAIMDEKSFWIARVAYLEGENMGFREQLDKLRAENNTMMRQCSCNRQGVDCAH